MNDKLKEKVDGLNKTEKEALAGMLMNSLRGSWRGADQRIQTLEYVLDELDLEDEDKIRTHCEAYHNDEYFDGRRFRDLPTYDKVLSCGFDRSVIESVMESVFTYLRNDLTWDLDKLDRLYG